MFVDNRREKGLLPYFNRGGGGGISE